ncbi:MAG: hypothetical protein KAS38_21660 [Anaerolineales bacterium]|nr:hypothetical protein [Anaerolineales bacterium]
MSITATIPEHRDPLEIMIRQEASEIKRKRACTACTKRPELVGGTGKCKEMKPKTCFKFDLDERAV